MTSNKFKLAILVLTVATVTLSQADSTAYSESGILTTFSNVGTDVSIGVQTSVYNDFYNENTPPSYGTYTNAPNDYTSAANQLAPSLMTANVTSTATGYSYTGWTNATETVYDMYNAGTAAETVEVSSTCYAYGSNALSGSGGSSLYSASAEIVEDFTGQGNWSVNASVAANNFPNYGLEGTSATGMTTITVNPNQTLDLVAYNEDITEAYSNPAPEPVTVGFLTCSFLGLVANRRAKRSV